MKDKRYAINKIFGGENHKKHEVTFNTKVISIANTRYEAEQSIVEHKKQRVSETV